MILMNKIYDLINNYNCKFNVNLIIIYIYNHK